MRLSLLDYLGCPGCASPLDLDTVESDGDEVIAGTLTCRDCAARYMVAGGIPRMNTAMEGLESVQRTFNWEWNAHHEGAFESETLFGRTPDEDWAMFLEGTRVSPHDLTGVDVLDAGCGSGAFTRLIAERSAAGVVIGVDMVDAVERAYAQTRELPNVHIVQGNVFKLPFRRELFGLIWCNGVIHHTPDAAAAHASLSRHVRPGGILYVWVYAKRFNPFRFTKDIFDAIGLTRLSEPQLFTLVEVVSRLSLWMLSAYRSLRRLPGLRPRSAWGHRTVRPRTLAELKLTWFDALSPAYDSRHTEEEVIGWFRREGFHDVHAIAEPKVGVRGVAPAPIIESVDAHDRSTVASA